MPNLALHIEHYTILQARIPLFKELKKSVRNQVSLSANYFIAKSPTDKVELVKCRSANDTYSSQQCPQVLCNLKKIVSSFKFYKRKQ